MEDSAEVQERTYTQQEVNTLLGQRLAQYADYDQIKAELTELRRVKDDETKSAVDEAVKEARREVSEQWGKRFIELKAQSIAAVEGYQDPTDASRFVDLADVSFNADSGELDEEAITTRVRETAEARPYLLQQRGNVKSSDVGLGTAGNRASTDGASAFSQMEGLSF